MALIYLNDVPLIGQPTGDTCWLTAAEMVWAYFSTKGKGLETPRNIIDNPSSTFHPVEAIEEFQKNKGKAIGQELIKAWNDKKGLPPEETEKLVFYGLTAIKKPVSNVWTIEMLFHLIERFGPLWVGGGWAFGFKHAIVIIGADTTSERIYYNDPLPEGKGSLKYWEESTMRVRLADDGTIMAFTNGNLSADDFNGTVESVMTRFAINKEAPDDAVKG